EFARRGWVAVGVMRRGYGSSEGEFSEGYGRCQNPDYLSAGRESANDIRAAVRVMREKPYVDSSKIISVGRSAGAYATVALTAESLPGLIAAISFAGGRGSVREDFVCEEQSLVEAFRTFGQTSRTPMLWVYSENDRYFHPRLAREMHKAFTAAGGRAELIIAPAFGSDGHKLFSKNGIPLLVPYVFDFLD
ncbi:MAG: dienelactone hydrolase family protein, partial [Deltaproteobacteria bacterium]|nr:dienelactone hydrolase family protein [Deltaproteobacteria bacterium]